MGLPFGGLQVIVPSVLWRVGRFLNAPGELLTMLVFVLAVEKISGILRVLALLNTIKSPTEGETILKLALRVAECRRSN